MKRLEKIAIVNFFKKKGFVVEVLDNSIFAKKDPYAIEIRKEIIYKAEIVKNYINDIYDAGEYKERWLKEYITLREMLKEFSRILGR